MNYLYSELLNEKRIDFSVLKKGDTFEVRLNELPISRIDDIFLSIEKLKLKTELSFKKTNDAYCSIQVFSFS